ncbi:Aim25p NDAI_0D00450 [Naumovozyma dairenensis CBS 421]|uniref:Phospholipid scramblase n=1 Tax=Naumovozyma dairenensis (strain ATCC 10597 / BCRC 20456 / CBS 421 / NBRC 0211 / NRRL Y-12639) TaxID=1071378 RepID=G0W998_NAUDC|nr:hypothetical protein NDAI_0D00450 [Naumovozyma dairenensis CBS 421]CCD24359.1 hypothetical protein NDAI_0D00450 [Naumovozyma dairenensis CBS 421]
MLPMKKLSIIRPLLYIPCLSKRSYSSAFKRVRNNNTPSSSSSNSRSTVKNNITLPQETSPYVIQPNNTWNSQTSFLNEPTILIERQIEMMNVFLGYEQSNKYIIMDVMGNRLGYMIEKDLSLWKSILRQFYKLHRPFTVDVFDNWNNLIMSIKRPFSWINSHIKTYVPREYEHIPSSSETSGSHSVLDEHDGILIGETIQNWHLWRRRYELFQRSSKGQNEGMDQFGEIDAPFLSFEFPVLDSRGKIMASIDRNWVGLGREMFTDTGVYNLRFDSRQSFNGIYPQESMSNQVLNLNQRAILLANAVSIDFDYFSRHSRHTGGGLLSFGNGGDYD